MNVGIDALAFSTSKYFLDLSDFAQHRKADYNKYVLGIGQKQMSVFPPQEDIITMAFDASEKVLQKIDDKNSIDLVIFATESSLDLSKSSGMYIHKFLGLKNECRIMDFKQACYSATGALQLAKSYVKDNVNSKVLIVGSDIVRYVPETSGEPTQGGAAIAIVVSRDPSLASIDQHFGVYSSEVMDFWRPTYSKEALCDGKLSAFTYLKYLSITFEQYLSKSGLQPSDFACSCYHAPFGKIATKANKQIFGQENSIDVTNSLQYNSIIGNSCSASLYICLISLLENSPKNFSQQRIGMFSYGSGSVAEYFSVTVLEKYKNMLSKEKSWNMLQSRTQISFDEYEMFNNYSESISDLSRYKDYSSTGRLQFCGVKNNIRIYEICS